MDQSIGVTKNQSLKKAIRILEVMADFNGASRLQDIANAAELSPSTALRFINTFIDFGYISQDKESTGYYLTLKLADLGYKTKEHFSLQKSLSKYVKIVAKRFNEAASLCIESDMKMVYIVAEEGPQRILQTLSRIGRIAPMHATGTGKLHLLNYSDEQLQNLVNTCGLNRYTDNTITDLDSLKKELNRIRSQGYALDNEECEEGVRCIAVPIYDYSNRIVAAISMSAPVTRLSDERCQRILPFLKEISLNASRELGYHDDSESP